MTSVNVDLARSVIARWEAGDFSSATWADPGLEWVVIGGPTPGRWRGLPAVADSLRDFLSAFADLRLEADEYRELDTERVLVLVRYRGRGRGSGVELEQMQTLAANIFEFCGGKVSTFVHYWDRERAFADLGLAREASAADPPD